MVKSKKMSKTSIAVIVLAILLVLSLCLGLTGAWFTDAGVASPTQNISFGDIDVNLTGPTIAAGNWANAVPGDSSAISGSFTVPANCEDMYVFVNATAEVDDSNGTEIDLYTTNACTTPIVTATLNAFTSGNGWTLCTDADGSSAIATANAAGEYLFYVGKTNAAKTMSFGGTVTFSNATGNWAFTPANNDDGYTLVWLNLDSDLTLTVKVQVGYIALQARNLNIDGITTNTVFTSAAYSEITRTIMNDNAFPNTQSEVNAALAAQQAAEDPEQP